jgi:hypothetical protein
MTRIGDMFPESKYLKAADLQGARLPLNVRIAHVLQEEIGTDEGGRERKPVVYFAGKTKGLVLNRVNASMLVEIAGTDDTDQWTDVVVGLDVQRAQYKGQLVPALRVVRPPRVHPHQTPRAAAPAAAAPSPRAPRVAGPPQQQRPAPSPWSEPAPDEEPVDDVPSFGHPDDDIPF